MRLRPHALLDAVLDITKWKNDAEACRVLDVVPPVFSRIRSRKQKVSAHLILLIHEHTGMSVATIRKLIDKS